MKKEKQTKYGGRKKGTPNKVTIDLRIRITDLIDVHFDKLIEDIAQLEPKERIDAMIKLFEYSLPKLQRVEVDAGDVSQQIIFNEIKTYEPKTLDEWYDINSSNNAIEESNKTGYQVANMMQ